MKMMKMMKTETPVMERAQQHVALSRILLASSDRGPHAVGGAQAGPERL